MRRAKQLIVSCFGRHYHKKMLRAFVQYKDVTVIQRNEDRERAKRDSLVGRFVGRLALRTQAAAYAGWSAAVAQRARNRVAIARSLGRLRNKTLASSFHTWNEQAQDARRAKYLIVSILHRHYHKVMFKSFVHYKDWTVCKRAEDLAGERRQTLLARFSARMARKTEASAFRGWVATVRERVRNRVTVARSLGRLRNKALAAALHGWRTFTAARHEARSKIITIITRKINKRSKFYLVRWKSWCAEARAAEREDRRKELSVQRCVARIKLRRVAGCLAGWRSAVRER